MTIIRKWFPFIGLLSVALFSSVYFFTFGNNEPYFPETANPGVIYQQACAHCHGKNGEGSGMLYPAFDHSKLNTRIIQESIENGTWLMPKFENIKGDTLKNLSEYIYNKEYLK